jgi:hypothetical protein
MTTLLFAFAAHQFEAFGNVKLRLSSALAATTKIPKQRT